MIFKERLILKDLLQILSVVGFCLFISCVIGKKTPVSTADETVRVKSNKEAKIHNLEIIHPGDPESVPIALELVQYFDNDGNPQRYSLWVDSVICRDETCEIVKVELFWDAFGNYDKYFVEKGEDLTKLDHVPFSKEDHAKLQRILKDKESPLREVTKDGLVGKKAKSAVDGVAGATVLTLNSTVVLGAGYTCYDLWHWANGEVSKIIRDLSGKSSSIAHLTKLLNSKKDDQILFAIKNLTERKVFDSKTREVVISSMQSGGDDLIGPALEYLEKASLDFNDYLSTVDIIFSDCSSGKRVYIITALTKDKRSVGKSLFNSMSQKLYSLESYHEVHLILSLLEKRKVWTSDIEANAVKLLDHPKFFYSRRAYWFLKKHQLNPANQKKVDSYFKKNQLRLL